MKPKQKAEELVEKYQKVELLKDVEGMWDLLAIECAKIAVDEIISINHNVKCDAGERIVNAMVDYYEEVKNELNNMS